jgi:hypothetical protein
MTVVWIIIKIVIYAQILSVIYRQSNNFIFILAQRPKTWILFVGILGITNMLVAYYLEWDPRLVGAAILIMISINGYPSMSNKERDIIGEAYSDLGIPHGPLQSKIGLAIFFISSTVFYILLFSEKCNARNECISLFKELTS